MKLAIATSLTLLIVISGCYTDPDFSETPRIEFREVQFIRQGNLDANGDPAEDDQLSFTIYYEDGDGDLGLYGDEFQFPYNEFLFYAERNDQGNIESTDSFYLFDDPDVDPGPCELAFGLIVDNETISDERLSTYLILEDGTMSDKYKFIEASKASEFNYSVDDLKTYYVARNPRYYNFYLTIEAREDSTVPFDDIITSCSNFNARFRFDEIFINNPVSGSITYTLNFLGYATIYKNQELRAKITVLDRAGNVSNEVVSGFRLN